jgi:hypothetical protein
MALSLDEPMKIADHAALKKLRAFAAGTTEYKAVVAHGLKTRGLVLGAWAHGFTHLSGDAISEEMDSVLEVKWPSADRVFAAYGRQNFISPSRNWRRWIYRADALVPPKRNTPHRQAAGKSLNCRAKTDAVPWQPRRPPPPRRDRAPEITSRAVRPPKPASRHSTRNNFPRKRHANRR